MHAGDQRRRVRLALIGSGIFARDAHLPALLELQDSFTVAAVFSRSADKAQALAARAALPGEPPPAVYTDLAALLARDDIEAVDIILPIPAQAEIVAQAIAAGKHVVSEKPIAPTHAEAQQLIDLHRRHPAQVWMVAENWRYEEAFVRAAELLRTGAIGRPIAAHWTQYALMDPGNKYYVTPWRRSGEVAGGLLLDSGVHYVAVLRMLLGEVASVSAVVTQARADLPPMDTMAATLRFESGVLATYLCTYAASAPKGTALTVAGSTGSLYVERGRIELTAEGATQVIPCGIYTGVREELAAFAAAVQVGAPQRNSPAEALRDLRVIEAMLSAAEEGREQRVG